jgi:ADP-ribose pyrophosphatase YjhB (NUDIX family)
MSEAAGKFWKVIPEWLRVFLTRRLHYKFTVSAAGIIVNPEGKVLLLDHLFRPASGWGVPGGFIEKNETGEAGLRREIKEEVGLEIGDVRLYKVRTIKRHIEIVMVAKAEGEPVINSREIRSARWFALDEMPAEMNLRQQFMIRAALDAQPRT